MLHRTIYEVLGIDTLLLSTRRNCASLIARGTSEGHLLEVLAKTLLSEQVRNLASAIETCTPVLPS